MGTKTMLHGDLPPNVRDPQNAFGAKPDATPQAKLIAARARVADLQRKHAAARNALQLAVDDNVGSYDFNALKTAVHNLARELESSSEEVGQWESVVAELEKADKQSRFDAALLEVRKARDEFAEHFKHAALALGRFYSRGAEIVELSNVLGSRLPNGVIYRLPEATAAIAEVGKDPNPLPELLDAGYAELQTAQSWRRHCAVVPLIPKSIVQKGGSRG